MTPESEPPPAVESRMPAPMAVQKVIWQVCESLNRLPEEYARCRGTWIELNPEWRIELVTNEESRTLFTDFLPDYLEAFDSLPLGIMKADMWRYAVLLAHGGIYADVDTYCLAPVDRWISPANEGLLHICCEERTPWFCQWVIHAPAGHPVLKAVLDLIVERIVADSVVDIERPNCVHHYTGPDVWSEAIKRSLGTKLSTEEIRADRPLADSGRILVHPTGFFADQVVRHGYASFTWGRHGYLSWRDDIRREQIGQSGQQAERLKEIFVPRRMDQLKRYGGKNDGAFVLGEALLQKSSYLLSLGDDVNFYRDVTAEGIPVITAERDIFEDRAEGIQSMVDACELEMFSRRAPAVGSGASTFSIKMDAEGSEYRLLRDCPRELLERCDQLAIEFHNLPNGGMLDGREIEATWNVREAAVLKVLETHHLVHLHGNNHKDLIHGFPEVLECLFVNKRHFTSEPPVWTAGSPRSGYDWPNHPYRPQLALDWWTGLHPKRPRIALVSLWTRDMGDHFDGLAAKNDTYCQERSYGCHIYQDILEPAGAASWSKILAIQRHLRNYEWILWVDADAVIADRGVDLERYLDPGSDLIVSNDGKGISTGSFLIRNSQASLNFLSKVWIEGNGDASRTQLANDGGVSEMGGLRVKVDSFDFLNQPV